MCVYVFVGWKGGSGQLAVVLAAKYIVLIEIIVFNCCSPNDIVGGCGLRSLSAREVL